VIRGATRGGALLFTVLLALLLFSSAALANITVRVELLDSYGNPIDGAVVQDAYGGTWNAFGTTGGSGPGFVLKDFPDGTTSLKVRITYNQGSRELTQNIAVNPTFSYQTVEATILFISHTGVGIAGGKIDQGGSFWQHHGYTDAIGEFHVQLFGGANYKFRVTFNNTNQEGWFPVPGPIVFQTGQVHWTGDSPKPVKASLGGSWINFFQDMELLPGTYKFVFDDGTNMMVTVTAGAITYIPCVPNNPPTANADGPHTIDEGNDLALDGSGSSDTDGTIASYEWDLDNDGIFDDASGVSPTVTWAALAGLGLGDDGTYPVALKVTDDDGATGTGGTTLTVNNVAPTVTAPADTSGDKGSPISPGNASFTDPGTADTHTATVDWGDGNSDTLGAVISSFSVGSHTYAADGIYTATVTVTDDDGGIGSATFRITVNVIVVSVKALKYKDLNMDGDRDGGEPPLSGWTFTLYDCGGVIGSRTTDGTGTAVFGGLEPYKSYLVTETLQPGWTNSDPGDGTLSKTTEPLEPRASATLEFGNYQLGAIVAHKFNDKDSDGDQDSNEPNLSGWTMTLYSGFGCVAANKLTSGVTDSNGNVTFTNLQPGKYSVMETGQLGWSNTTPEKQDVTLVAGGSATARFGNHMHSGGYGYGGGSVGPGYEVVLGALNICANRSAELTGPNFDAATERKVTSRRWRFLEQPWSTPETRVYAIPHGSHVIGTLKTSSEDQNWASFIPDVPGDYIVICEVTFKGGTSTRYATVVHVMDCGYPPPPPDPVLPDDPVFLAYPNPSDGPEVHFEVLSFNPVDTFVVMIFDLAGQLIWSTSSSADLIDWPKTNDDGEAMSRGGYIYFARALVDGVWHSHKAVFFLN